MDALNMAESFFVFVFGFFGFFWLCLGPENGCKEIKKKIKKKNCSKAFAIVIIL